MLDVFDLLLRTGLRISKDLHGLVLVAKRASIQALRHCSVRLFLALFQGAQKPGLGFFPSV